MKHWNVIQIIIFICQILGIWENSFYSVFFNAKITISEIPFYIIKLNFNWSYQKISVSKLIGAPPGYVGYEEKGILTEKIKNRPYSILLFDEIEKAHPDLFNILLQILDEGKLTDSPGKEVNFKKHIQGNSHSTKKHYFKIKKKKICKSMAKLFKREYLWIWGRKVEDKIDLWFFLKK